MGIKTAFRRNQIHFRQTDHRNFPAIFRIYIRIFNRYIIPITIRNYQIFLPKIIRRRINGSNIIYRVVIILRGVIRVPQIMNTGIIQCKQNLVLHDDIPTLQRSTHCTFLGKREEPIFPGLDNFLGIRVSPFIPHVMIHTSHQPSNCPIVHTIRPGCCKIVPDFCHIMVIHILKTLFPGRINRT